MKYRLIKSSHDPDKFLTTPTRQVTTDDDLSELMNALQIICKQSEGVGISANQVGSNLSVFLLLQPTETFYINPTIEVLDDTPEFFNEGCLSLPDQSVVTMRPRKIKLYSANNEPKILEGSYAVMAQHEYDHLCGKLMTKQEIK